MASPSSSSNTPTIFITLSDWIDTNSLTGPFTMEYTRHEFDDKDPKKMGNVYDQIRFHVDNIPSEHELDLKKAKCKRDYRLALAIWDANNVTLISYEPIVLSEHGLIEKDKPKEQNSFHMKELEIVRRPRKRSPVDF
ncbi:unnamed protein product [Rotaria sordida]|uniref:Uncharacterized protein n=1 Tax=Rotaria sordida TaxID=392033 RepID=A0A815GID2_9BILA|nr:unnamed protein product [Rotaria sordida]CAF1595879.1 unnamed protein product [Rotaria sordida]